MSDIANLAIVGVIAPGTVVVLREERQPDETDDEQMERVSDLVREITRACGHKDWMLAVLATDESLELYDVDAMREAGWVRAG